jgi:hypothetical protein
LHYGVHVIGGQSDDACPACTERAEWSGRQLRRNGHLHHEEDAT